MKKDLIKLFKENKYIFIVGPIIIIFVRLFFLQININPVSPNIKNMIFMGLLCCIFFIKNIRKDISKASVFLFTLFVFILGYILFYFIFFWCSSLS